MSDYKILAINPGSTSTKIAVFKGGNEVYSKKFTHTVEELSVYNDITDQYEFRKNIILEDLKDAGIALEDFDAIIGRGGLIRPVPSGIFNVNEELKADLRKGVLGKHASNLGGLIADDIAKSIGIDKAYIADPVVVDEFCDEARVSGHPLFERKSIFHALNQKAVARKYADEIGKKYEDLNLIVVHMGGGVSVGAHKKGKVVDVNQALDGDGPFSPERSGTLPAGDLAKLCFSGKYTLDEVKKMITGKGGFAAYLGTNNAQEVNEKAVAGDKNAKLINDAMAYQIAKEIGSMYAVLHCEADCIIFTGGLAYNKPFTDLLKSYVGKMSATVVYPGEDEMEALAYNALLALKGQIVPMNY